MIPFNDLARANQKLHEELLGAIERVLNKNWFVLGDEGVQFEKEFSDYMGTKYCVGVSNGLDALRLILMALELPKDSEVIVPANTFIATALAVSSCGYQLRLVDVDEDTMLMDPKKVEAAVTDKTRVIMPVHLYGSACDMDKITKIAQENDLFVVEDNAQAQGCVYAGRRTGTFGIASGTSFYPGKNIGALGDAGAVVTDNAPLADRIRALANYGSSKRYHHDYPGCNTRLDEIQAAVLRVKLKYLEQWNQSRSELARFFRENINHPLVRFPVIPFSSVWHIFLVRIADNRRDEFAAYMEKNGVQTAIHYPIPIHKQKAYADKFSGEHFPVSERLATEIVTLPMFPYMEQAERNKIVDLVNEWQ